ncbi:MAG: FkbM family methyltransferase, partial [Rubricella sp.]
SLLIYHDPRALRRWRRFHRTILSPGDLVFDVGAHVGTRARAMRAAGARVVAIEPQQPFAAFLRRTLPRDITLLETAVGAAEADAVMAVSTRHPTVSSLSADFVAGGRTAAGFEHVRWDRVQPVRVTTLDALIARFGPPAYIKIDVEGAELAVLEGLSRRVPLISVEYLPAFPHLAHRLVERLAAAGLERFNIVAGETGGFLWEDWRDAATVKAWLGTLPLDATSGDLFARAGRP